MADTKISALTAATSVGASDIIPIVQSGTNKKATKALVNVLQVSTVILTDAQIKALPTTPITLVAAQGDNKAIIPSMVVLHSTITANYTNIDASDGEIGISISGAGYILQPLINRTAPDTISLVTTLLNTDGAIFRMIDSQNDVVGAELVISGVVPASANNQPLVIESYNGGGNYTGGNAANTLKVTVFYIVVDL